MEYPIKDIKIERIATFETRKDGSALITHPKDGSTGKAYKKVLIDVNSDCIDDFSFTGKLSMLDFDGVANDWQVGDLITGTIVHDGDYWNFELPRVNLRDKVSDLEAEIKELKAERDELRQKLIDQERASLTESDLPF